MSDKEFTEKSHPNHKIVKALTKKGYTGFKVQWGKAISRNRGWSVTLQDGTFIRGYDLGNLHSKVEALPTIQLQNT